MVDKAAPNQFDSEPVWTYRGYELRAGEFNAAMLPLFRAEVARATAFVIVSPAQGVFGRGFSPLDGK